MSEANLLTAGMAVTLQNNTKGTKRYLNAKVYEIVQKLLPSTLIWNQVLKLRYKSMLCINVGGETGAKRILHDVIILLEQNWFN